MEYDTMDMVSKEVTFLNTLLLVVDIQQTLVDENPYEKEAFLRTVQTWIQKFREHGMPILFVRHTESEGDLSPSSPGWNIAREVDFRESDEVMNKRFNSAFKETLLDAYLQEREIHQIVVIGMQTEYCIDFTIKSAFDRGYRVLVPRGGNTTYDTKYLKANTIIAHYQEAIWRWTCAKVDDSETLMEEIWKNE